MTGRILIVEDDPLSRDLLERALRSKGFQTSATEDGAACLEWLEHDETDLILLDVSMPGMSGLDVLRTIRERQASDQLPVILVSALTDSDDVIAGLEAGANDYVVKPVNLPILLARMNVCLRLKQSVARLVEAERVRVLLESLSETCDHLAQPLAECTSQIEMLVQRVPDDKMLVQSQLRDVLSCATKVADLLERLRSVAAYREVPYTEGIASFVSASLERVRDEDR
ncbi:MAG: response regulator transcription factor [Planctomycetota bacterium]|jgi:DNA-binding response OmpR family regulator